MKILINLLQSLLFQVLRIIFNIWIQNVWWLINGTLTDIKRNHSNNKIQVQRILFRYKLDIISQPCDKSNFITVHHSFEDFNYLLEHNVTLYRVAKNEAYFIETDSQVDATNLEYGSFIKEAQFRNAQYLIVLPIHMFNQFADEIDVPRKPVIYIGNHSRCGGTLLCQVFQASRACAVFADTDALDDIYICREQDPYDVYLAKLKRGLSALCKPITGEYYVIKSNGSNNFILNDLDKVLPTVRILYIYRNCLPTAKSFERLLQQLPYFLILKFLFGILPKWLINAQIKQMKFPVQFPFEKIRDVDLRDEFTYAVFLWAVRIKEYQYVLSQNENLQVMSVKYEYLLKNPLKLSEQLFNYCGIKHDKVAVQQAFQNDSQERSIFNRNVLNSYKNANLTPEKIQVANYLSGVFSVPRIDEDCILPKTVVCNETK